MSGHTPSQRNHGLQDEFYFQSAVTSFCFWIQEEEQSELRSEIRQELKGKDLACWCKEGMPCRADVLLQIANNEQGEFSCVEVPVEGCTLVELKRR